MIARESAQGGDTGSQYLCLSRETRMATSYFEYTVFILGWV